MADVGGVNGGAAGGYEGSGIRVSVDGSYRNVEVWNGKRDCEESGHRGWDRSAIVTERVEGDRMKRKGRTWVRTWQEEDKEFFHTPW